jgi:hypothetical protein
MPYLCLGFWKSNASTSAIATKLVELQDVDTDLTPIVLELAKVSKECLVKETLRWPKYQGRNRDLETIEELTKIIERLGK